MSDQPVIIYKDGVEVHRTIKRDAIHYIHTQTSMSAYDAVWWGGWWLEWPADVAPYPDPMHPPEGARPWRPGRDRPDAADA